VIDFFLFPRQAKLVSLELETGNTRDDYNIELCNLKGSPWIVRALIEIIMRNSAFEFKCPLKKASKLKVNGINLSNFDALARFMSLKRKQKTSLLFYTGKPPVPLFSVNMYLMRIEVD
jgi:hypothetical protein